MMSVGPVYRRKEGSEGRLNSLFSTKARGNLVRHLLTHFAVGRGTYFPHPMHFPVTKLSKREGFCRSHRKNFAARGRQRRSRTMQFGERRDRAPPRSRATRSHRVRKVIRDNRGTRRAANLYVVVRSLRVLEAKTSLSK